MKISAIYQKIRNSVQLQFIVVFLVVILTLLALLNSYPLFVSRGLTFSSKENIMLGQASVMSSALGVLDSLNENEVAGVMRLLDVTPLSRVMITDNSGKVLYDTSASDPRVGSFALFPEVFYALSSKNVFYSKLEGGAFLSRAAMPIVGRGTILGAVYLVDYDEYQAQLLSANQKNLLTISIVIGVVAIALITFLAQTLTRRITALVRAIRIVREGEYDYRLTVNGRDELAELAEEVNNMTSRLQTTEEMRRRFVSDASHELNTPLASIRLLSDSIAQSESMRPETMREFAEDIGSEAERLQRTTEKLLCLTRLNNEYFAPATPVNVILVAENVMNMLSPLAIKKGLRLDANMTAEAIIKANEDDLHQIIFNLVENAIKYTQPGGEVSLSIFEEYEEVQMYVDDNGIGIPEEDMPHIFTRFYRVDKARSREAGGSGLGLSIVHDAVIMHGGTINVVAREGGGSRFALSFPLYRDNAEGGQDRDA